MSTTTAFPLPSPTHATARDVVTYIATDVRGERFITATGTLGEAQVLTERDPEAIPYFADGMVWTEVEPLPPLPSHTYGRRQWIGKVVTEPYASAREFRIVQQVIETPYEGREDIREEVLRRRGLLTTEDPKA